MSDQYAAADSAPHLLDGPPPPLTPIPMPAAAPKLLAGRYVVDRQLGRGSHAEVYLAWDLDRRRWVAVKRMTDAARDDEGIRRRFSVEAMVMAEMDHAHVLRVLDVDVDADNPFMVTELARGGSLASWVMSNGVMPPVLACQAIAQACEGLAHAHARGVIHRDVKPQNLLVTEDGRVKVTDFGIAKLDGRFGMTETGSMLGTVAYMAPEQRSDSKHVDVRCDVYALGATLFRLVTGRRSADLFFAHAKPELLDGVPEGLRDLIRKACSYDAEDRHATVADLREALLERVEALADTDAPASDLTSSLMHVPQDLWHEEDLPTYVPAHALNVDPAPIELGHPSSRSGLAPDPVVAEPVAPPPSVAMTLGRVAAAIGLWVAVLAR
ncbi:MAG: serine/threonine protein kinase [Myxococcales bacterium]|nr:serine/threonine protein kinase [Myxococcales bacterium]